MNPWLISSLILFVAWLIIFIFSKKNRKEIIWTSLFTIPLGLTEPIFVPEYWNPPSLFNLASRTGFDIESLIFAFSIGGIAGILYELFFHFKHKRINKKKRHHRIYILHLLAILSPIIIFLLLYLLTDLNPIYSVIISLFFGGIAVLICRPDLKKKILIGGILFLFLYFSFFLLFNFLFPGWVEQIWNLADISGILFLGIPIEEFLFAFGVGLMWSGIYEHIKGYS